MTGQSRIRIQHHGPQNRGNGGAVRNASQEDFQRLDLDEIYSGSGICLKNAEEFLGEGAFFEKTAKPPRWARANAAYQHAIEETGKAYLLLQFYREKKLSLPTDYVALRKAFLNHGPKTKQSLEVLRLAFNKWSGSRPILKKHVEAVNELLKKTDKYEHKRQESLYTSFKNGKFLSPQDLVSEGDMRHTLLVALGAFNLVQQYWYGINDRTYVYGSKGIAALRDRKADKENGPFSSRYLATLKNRK